MDTPVVVTFAIGIVMFEVGTATAIVTSGTAEISAMGRLHFGETQTEIGAAAIVILTPGIRCLGSAEAARVRRLFRVTSEMRESAMRESLWAATLI